MGSESADGRARVPISEVSAGWQARRDEGQQRIENGTNSNAAAELVDFQIRCCVWVEI